MDTPSWPTTSLPPLVAMVLQDPSHIDLSAGFGDVRTAGSAQWPLLPTGAAQAILDTLRHAAQMLGCVVPESLRVQAGQLFYHNGQLEEVRLRGTCPDPRPGELLCLETSWSTPTQPCLQLDSDTTLQLDLAEAGRPHLSALVVTDETAPQGLMMICT